MKLRCLAALILAPLATGQVKGFQINSVPVSISATTTATEAILHYVSAVDDACGIKVADMNRRITIVAGSQSGGVATITTQAPHGLTAGSQVYLEQTGAAGWDGWQTITAVPDSTHFSFASSAAGSPATGTVGVLVDDVNPNLFPGADQDSRPGNPNSGRNRVFVIGKRTAEAAADGNRYTRALQVNSRHHYTLTCGTQAYSHDFTTQNLPLGDTHNDGPPVDRSHPGQYAYPTVQWANRGQSLIDPVTGVRSTRATTPVGTASTVRNFETALDRDQAWQNPTAPLTMGGAATFKGPCQGASCALFLRADSLSLPGGATYTSGYGEGSSLDWVAVTITNSSISNSSCASGGGGDDCKIVTCLTVNGVSCTSAEQQIALSNTPATYTIGSKTVGDLWQGSGTPAIARPDVSKATGIVNYTGATHQVTWASGNKFSIKWAPGSRIMVAGAEQTIASVQNELSLTLANPTLPGDLSNVAFSADNFGVLIRKKTGTADTVSIGLTTYQYGSSSLPAWAATSVQNCSPSTVSVSGVGGYDCFVDRELYWVSADGSDVRDLGYVGMSSWPDGRWSTSAICGIGSNLSQFDPLDGDTWYCMIQTYWQGMSIVKAHYQGPHTPYTPGAQLPDCGLNGGAQPCVAFTLMQPNLADNVSVAGPAFNPDYNASGYRAAYFLWGGVSLDGDILIYTREVSGQDSKGWQFIFTLGDRTPAGTGPNSIRPIAAASSYRHAPLTWCSIHTPDFPEDGWARFASNDFSYKGAGVVYGMALTSSGLTASVGGPGGLKTCPSNPFGVTGQVCTDITVNGEPTLAQDGSYLQDTQPGDLIQIDSESMRIVAKADSNHLTVQRGYLSTVAAHAGTKLSMACGTLNQVSSHESVWNYRADPYGTNSNWSSILVDPANVGGHLGEGGGVRVNSVATWYRVGESVCPKAILGTYGVCYQVRRGTLAQAIAAPTLGVAENPPFAGVLGIGNPNQVDTHPGPCQSQWCLDGRPMDGESIWGMIGSNTAPWVNTSGQLWKISGGLANLSPKTLTTMAYVGRSALVDISGPGSVLPTDSTGAYQYCVALRAGECRPDSSAGDIYVNAPYVSKPYCDYAGIAIQADDTNSICVGALGAYTGNLVQFGNTQEDIMGATVRRLGPAFSRWNQQSVYWNTTMTTNGGLAFSQVRWLDGIRSEDIITALPPFPASDSITRNTFVPIAVKIPPPPEQGTGKTAVVEFGYAENGSPDSYFCTSRQETCVAASNTLNQASPFYFSQTDTYSGVSCGSGCTVTVPALSQRVMYYRWKYLDGSGNVTAASGTHAMATP